MSKPQLEINCSHISREEAIRQKELSLQQDLNVVTQEGSALDSASRIWKEDETGNNVETIKNKITDTISYVKAHLTSQNILENEAISYGAITTNGLNLFEEDLKRRADTDFIAEIPNYMKKFVDYISLISSFEPEKQKAFLLQFPPDDRKEYQCNDGAKSRLETVFESAKGSPIVVMAHNATVEDIAVKFRESVYEGNHPHVAPFVNYLLGVDKELVQKNDNFFSNSK